MNLNSDFSSDPKKIIKFKIICCSKNYSFFFKAVEKALRSYHYFKGNGKLPASDIHGLLLGVETNIRDIAFRFCNFIGNEANSMQYPGIARFGKTPNEVFPLSKH